MTSYRWRPIEDLPHDWRILADPELPALGVVWKSGPQATDAMERVKRAASIETGAIEGVYRIERRVTDLLIERGIKAALIPHGTTDLSPEEVVHRIEQNAGALNSVFDSVASREPMTESFIKQLHASLILPGETSRARRRDGAFVDVEILRGDYKKWPNNPQRADGSVHEYCPPEHVASEMERLVRVHADHERLGVAPEAESAWLHHAFTQIHPFQDGNGRVARLLASMVLIRAGLFPMVVRMAERSAYIDSLERADAGDYSPLVQLIAKQQRSEILAVFKASGEDRAPTTIDEAIAAARDQLILSGHASPAEWLKARETAHVLRQAGHNEIGALRKKLREQFASGFSFEVEEAGTLSTVGDIASGFGYEAGDRIEHLILKFDGPRAGRIHLAFHSLGSFRGVLAAILYWEWANQPPVPLTDSFFQINYAELTEEAVKRFEDWLRGGLVRGITQWRDGVRA